MKRTSVNQNVMENSINFWLLSIKLKNLLYIYNIFSSSLKHKLFNIPCGLWLLEPLYPLFDFWIDKLCVILNLERRIGHKFHKNPIVAIQNCNVPRSCQFILVINISKLPVLYWDDSPWLCYQLPRRNVSSQSRTDERLTITVDILFLFLKSNVSWLKVWSICWS